MQNSESGDLKNSQNLQKKIRQKALASVYPLVLVTRALLVVLL